MTVFWPKGWPISLNTTLFHFFFSPPFCSSSFPPTLDTLANQTSTLYINCTTAVLFANQLPVLTSIAHIGVSQTTTTVLLINRPENTRPQFYPTNRSVLSREVCHQTRGIRHATNGWHKESTSQDDDIPPQHHPSSSISTLDYYNNGLVGFGTRPKGGFSANNQARKKTTEEKTQAQPALLARARQWMEEQRREDSRRASRSRMARHRTVDPAAFVKTNKESRAAKPDLVCIYKVKGLDFVGLGWWRE